ncbi:MAG: AarF/UbiB family protein [Desulforhopalus sp.]
MDFRPLIREARLDNLIPPEYSRFTFAVNEGLSLFLSGLPDDVQNRIVRDLLQLENNSAVAQKLGCLARNSPVLHKLGQVLARNQRLPLPLRLELQKLEWLAPSVPTAVIEAEIKRELGPLSSLDIILAPNAIAEASVAVVIPFAKKRTPPQGAPPRFDSVFKILKPGVEKALLYEFDLLDKVGSLLDTIARRQPDHHLEYRKLFSQITQALHKETQLEQEQKHLKQAAADYTLFTKIKIPELLSPYCSPRITAMERIYGRKLDAATITSSTTLKQVAELVVKALISHPLFSSSPQTLFHADPHAGNLFLTDTGHLALLDWSQADHLRKPQQHAICSIILAAMTVRQDKLLELISGLADDSNFNKIKLSKVISEALATVRQGTPPGFSWLIKLFDNVALEAGVRFPANVLLFRKALLTISGIVEELAGSSEYVDAILLWQFWQVFAEEWPERWQLPRIFQERSTHLTTADLFETTLDTFAASHDYYLKYWLSLFNTLSKR